MPGLVLKPSLEDFNRQELEDHLETKRVRRMAAAQVYYDGIKGKRQHESDQIARKWIRAFDLLKKDLENFDKAYDKMMKRLVDIGEFTEGYALVEDIIQDLEEE